MKALQLIAVLVALPMLGHGIQTEYFVKPNESTPCPTLSCHTLSHYLRNTEHYFTSNTRISFLHDIHNINQSGKFLVKNVFNLTLTGYNVSSSNAVIVCMQPASLKFETMENLVMKHLSIIYCGYPIPLLDYGTKYKYSKCSSILRGNHCTEAIKLLGGKQHWIWSIWCECSREFIHISLKIYVQQLLHPEFNQLFLWSGVMYWGEHVPHLCNT